jgi:4-hydroxybenzoyl-CoA reductase subunit beta
MQALPEFALRRPRSLEEAAVLMSLDAQAQPLAGGTDLLPNLRRGLGQPGVLVDLSGIAGFDAVEQGPDGSLRLGAGITLEALAAHPQVAARLPALAEAARAVAASAHRAAATLGGNLCQDTRCVYYNQSEWWRASNGFCLKRGGSRCHVAPQGERCHAAYCGDIAPVLLALDAVVEVRSVHGSRELPVGQLYRDDGAAHLALGAGELLAAVRLPPQPAGLRCRFGKVRPRGGIDFPLASAALVLRLERECVTGLRVALAGTNSHPLLLQGTDALVGHAVGDELVQALGKLVQQQAAPMRSSATPANHRRQVAVALVQRLLREAAT